MFVYNKKKYPSFNHVAVSSKPHDATVLYIRPYICRSYPFLQNIRLLQLRPYAAHQKKRGQHGVTTYIFPFGTSTMSRPKHGMKKHGPGMAWPTPLRARALHDLVARAVPRPPCRP